MEEDRPYSDTHLFSVRMWVENVGSPEERQIEWRGKVSHVRSGAMRYFRDWTAFIAVLQEMTAELENDSPVPTDSGQRQFLTY